MPQGGAAKPNILVVIDGAQYIIAIANKICWHGLYRLSEMNEMNFRKSMKIQTFKCRLVYADNFYNETDQNEVLRNQPTNIKFTVILKGQLSTALERNAMHVTWALATPLRSRGGGAVVGFPLMSKSYTSKGFTTLVSQLLTRLHAHYCRTSTRTHLPALPVVSAIVHVIFSERKRQKISVSGDRLVHAFSP